MFPESTLGTSDVSRLTFFKISIEYLLPFLTRGKYSINDNRFCCWIYNYYSYFPFYDSSLILNLTLRQGLKI